MRYYWRLYKRYFVINLKSLAIYDKDFYFAIIGMIIQNVLNILALQFIYLIVPTIGGYSFRQLLTNYAMATLAFAIFRCFFINTLNIADHVRRGTLDNLLVKPVNPLFSLITERFDEDAWGDLLVAILLVFGLQISSGEFWSIPIILLIALSTSLVFVGIALVGAILSLFSEGISDLSETVYDFFEFAKYPLSIYNSVVALLLTTLLPLGWVASLPQQLILIERRYYLLPLILLVPILFFGACYLLWRLFLQKYESTGT